MKGFPPLFARIQPFQYPFASEDLIPLGHCYYTYHMLILTGLNVVYLYTCSFMYTVPRENI